MGGQSVARVGGWEVAEALGEAGCRQGGAVAYTQGAYQSCCQQCAGRLRTTQFVSLGRYSASRAAGALPNWLRVLALQ